MSHRSNPSSGRSLPNRAWLALFLGLQLTLFGGAVYCAWTYAKVQEENIHRVFKGIPLPPITKMFLGNNEGFIAFIIPWLGYAIHLVIRGAVVPRELLAFSSTLIAALLVGAIAFCIGMSLPWGPRSYSSSWTYMHLDQQRLVEAFHAADRGDPEAHYRLYEHYANTTKQADLAEYYLRCAADLGEKGAVQELKQREWQAKRRKVPAIEERAPN